MDAIERIECEQFKCKLTPKACALRWSRGSDDWCASCADGQARAKALGIAKKRNKKPWQRSY